MNINEAGWPCQLQSLIPTLAVQSSTLNIAVALKHMHLVMASGRKECKRDKLKKQASKHAHGGNFEDVLQCCI